MRVGTEGNPVRVMVTGHRPPKLGGWAEGNPTEMWVRRNLRTVLERLQVKHEFIKGYSGMALGTDQWFAEVCNDLYIPWVAALPFVGQDSKWPAARQEHFAHLLTTACNVVRLDEGSYAPGKMHARNQWLVDHGEVAIAVWNGSGGGTGDCVQRIVKAGLPGLCLDPTKLKVGKLAG